MKITGFLCQFLTIFFYLYENFDFRRKFLMKNLIFWRKFWFLTKILLLDKILFFEQKNCQNFDFWEKFRFVNKISTFEQNFDFWAKFRFFTKISIFQQNFDFSTKFRFFTKISIFHHNRFLSKLLKFRFFGQKFLFRSKKKSDHVGPNLYTQMLYHDNPKGRQNWNKIWSSKRP